MTHGQKSETSGGEKGEAAHKARPNRVAGDVFPWLRVPLSDPPPQFELRAWRNLDMTRAEKVEHLFHQGFS